MLKNVLIWKKCFNSSVKQKKCGTTIILDFWLLRESSQKKFSLFGTFGSWPNLVQKSMKKIKILYGHNWRAFVSRMTPANLHCSAHWRTISKSTTTPHPINIYDPPKSQIKTFHHAATNKNCFSNCDKNKKKCT